MQSFILPANGKATPESIARKRKMAEAMMTSGIDTSPVGHWTQGAARMAQALVGGLGSRRADTMEAEGQQSAKDAMIKALNGGDKASLIDAASNPFMSSAGMNMVGNQWNQVNRDPMAVENDDLQNQLLRAQIAEKNLPPKPDLQSVGKDSVLYDSNTKTWITPPAPPQGAHGSGIFDSKSVEGQSLNYLVETGALTNEQAAQIGAGKPITGADGSMHFLTPQDIVKAAQQQAAGTEGQAPPQAGIPLGPAKKPEAQIKGESRESGIASSVATLTQGATPENPMPIFDDLGGWWNTTGNTMPGQTGRILMTPEGKQAADAARNVIQNYIYTLSGAQAPDSEVNRQMEMVIPSITDDPETIQKKKARLLDMIDTISVAAQGPGGAAQKQQQSGEPPSALQVNPNDPLGLR